MPKTTSSTSNALHNVNWPVQHVLAFTTTRHIPCSKDKGGASIPPFNEFNLGLHVNDDAERVLAHRDLLKRYIQPNQKIQWFNQVHQDTVAIVHEHQNLPITADAAITKSKNIALAIMTADCLPILLTNIEGDEIAAIHAGWRPLVANIIDKTVAKMESKPQHLYAWLGPCIGARAFEVGEEVKQQFCEMSLHVNVSFEQHFIATGNGKYLANMRELATQLLNIAGVKAIQSLDHCTFEMPQNYFSYRRDGQTGRMASVIAIRS